MTEKLVKYWKVSFIMNTNDTYTEIRLRNQLIKHNLPEQYNNLIVEIFRETYGDWEKRYGWQPEKCAFCGKSLRPLSLNSPDTYCYRKVMTGGYGNEADYACKECIEK